VFCFDVVDRGGLFVREQSTTVRAPTTRQCNGTANDAAVAFGHRPTHGGTLANVNA